MTAFELYWLFAKISALTFGGGYAMVPLFQNELVAKHALMEPMEFANLMAVAQATPGPIGLNAATYVGWTQGGWAGAFAATAGVITPSLVVTLAVGLAFERFFRGKTVETVFGCLRPVVVGIVAAAVVFFAETSVFTAPVGTWLAGGFGVNWKGAVVFVVVLAARLKWKRLGTFALLALAALLGWALQ